MYPPPHMPYMYPPPHSRALNNSYLSGYRLLLLCDPQLTLRDYFLHIAGCTSAPTTARSQLTSLGNQTNRTGSKMVQRPAQGSRTNFCRRYMSYEEEDTCWVLQK